MDRNAGYVSGKGYSLHLGDPRRSDGVVFRERASSPIKWPRFRSWNVILVALGCSALATFILSQLWSRSPLKFPPAVENLFDISSILISRRTFLPGDRDRTCRMHSCFDVYRCKDNENAFISVYVYPIGRFVDSEDNTNVINRPPSKEFREIALAIRQSDFYTDDISKACVIVPAVDTLNQNGLDLQAIGRILASLPSWSEGGKNHLIFNMLPGGPPAYHTALEVNMDKALLAGGGFSTQTYRPGFDVSIPVFNPLTRRKQYPQKTRESKWLLLSTQVNFHKDFRLELEETSQYMANALVLDVCSWNESAMDKRCHGHSIYNYPDIMQHATFCVVIRGARLGQTTLLDALMMGCIPVIVADDYVLPFTDVLDWKRAAIQVSEDEIKEIPSLLQDVSQRRIDDMRRQGRHFWKSYFSSMAKITLTTLKVLNDRVNSHRAWSYEDWNAPFLTTTGEESFQLASPLFMPLQPPKWQGFTAVVLSYNRLETMFNVLKRIAITPSLAKIVVVWNNVATAPPPKSQWPELQKPVAVVRSKANRLSNRFYPHSEIETEAILAIDDDILMLTPDELEFGFQVWREFPDRIVGFPGRVHLSTNVSHKFKYDSEWRNDLSMVLTGAAFHHKHFSHLYTFMMPASIRHWVDSHMNCEDIAMNFMATNYTGKAPIKVTPRKRFRCGPGCTKESLWTDPTHFVERSECLNEFVRHYGKMTLKPVTFRADPVLLGEKLPRSVKKYNDLGIL